MTRRTVGGALTLDALAILHRTQNADDANRMRYFEDLTHEEQVAAVRRMAAEGLSEHALAHCTRWSIEYIRRVLGDGAA